MIRTVTFTAALILATAASAETLPLNPAVTQDRIYETICVPGYTKTIRPPVSYTNGIKIRLMEREGLPLELIGDKILDHVIPLEVGGSPDDPRNLVLQDQDDSRTKDKSEHYFHRAVCDGRISLRAAQQILWDDARKSSRR